VLWLGQTREQVEQAKNALGLNGPQPGRWTPSGIETFAIDVKCWQGVSDNDDLSQYDVFVADEIHSATDSLYAISQRCKNSWWKIGLTATYVRNDDRELLIEAAFGECVVSIPAERVLAEGHLCPGKVIFLPVGEPDEIKRLVEQEASQELEEALRRYRDPEQREQQGRRIMWRYAQKLGVRESKMRNGLAAMTALTALEKNEVVLILVDTKEQGRAIKKLIPGSQFVFAGMPVKEGRRDELVADLNEGRLNCLIATDLANQGLDVPRVATIIRARSGKGGKSGYLIQQQAARAQRTHGEKQVATIIDFLDQHHPMLLAQSWKRVQEYKKQKFQIELPKSTPTRSRRNNHAQTDMIGARV
jgi:superfamily II DNA or RNA helicase